MASTGNAGALVWAALLAEGDTGPQGVLWRHSETIPQPHITRFRNWSHEREIKQFRGTKDLLGRDDHLQLLPLRPTTSLFIGDITTTSTETR
ncbi:hypothetical protein GCM10025787_03070 [Saccharopolyspora rosea]